MQTEEFLALGSEDRVACWRTLEETSPDRCADLLADEQVRAWRAAADVFEYAAARDSEFAVASAADGLEDGSLDLVRRYRDADSDCRRLLIHLDLQQYAAVEYEERVSDGRHTITEWVRLSADSREDLLSLTYAGVGEALRGWLAGLGGLADAAERAASASTEEFLRLESDERLAYWWNLPSSECTRLLRDERVVAWYVAALAKEAIGQGADEEFRLAVHMEQIPSEHDRLVQEHAQRDRDCADVAQACAAQRELAVQFKQLCLALQASAAWNAMSPVAQGNLRSLAYEGVGETVTHWYEAYEFEISEGIPEGMTARFLELGSAERTACWAELRSKSPQIWRALAGHEHVAAWLAAQRLGGLAGESGPGYDIIEAMEQLDSTSAALLRKYRDIDGDCAEVLERYELELARTAARRPDRPST